MTPLRVGFIGLGNMGYRMALNLVKSGHEVVVQDVKAGEAARAAASARATELRRKIGEVGHAAEDIEAKAGEPVGMLENLLLRGAHAVGSPAGVVEALAARRRRAGGTDIVITMLPGNAAVEQVYLGEGSLLSVSAGDLPRLMIDASTVAPDLSRRLAQRAHAAGGVNVLDAPVSGGIVGAAAASLTFMVGGEEAAFESSKSLLSDMGKRIIYCGPPGSGQAVKLCNNLALGIQMASIAEALSLGQRLGLDAKLLSGVFNTSSARCWSSDTYNPCPGVMEGVPASRQYEGGFGNALMVKDLGLAADAAAAEGIELRMGSRALQLYEEAVLKGDGYGAQDFGSIYKHVYGGKDA